MFDLTQVGLYIATRRRDFAMTQMELADRMDVSYQAVSSWERGQTMPDISKLLELAAVLGTTVDGLLSGGKLIEGMEREPAPRQAEREKPAPESGDEKRGSFHPSEEWQQAMKSSFHPNEEWKNTFGGPTIPADFEEKFVEPFNHSNPNHSRYLGIKYKRPGAHGVDDTEARDQAAADANDLLGALADDMEDMDQLVELCYVENRLPFFDSIIRSASEEKQAEYLRRSVEDRKVAFWSIMLGIFEKKDTYILCQVFGIDEPFWDNFALMGYEKRDIPLMSHAVKHISDDLRKQLLRRSFQDNNIAFFDMFKKAR